MGMMLWRGSCRRVSVVNPIPQLQGYGVLMNGYTIFHLVLYLYVLSPTMNTESKDDIATLLSATLDNHSAWV